MKKTGGVFLNLVLIVIVFYYINRLVEIITLSISQNWIEKISSSFLSSASQIMQNPFHLSLLKNDLLISLSVTGIILLMIQLNKSNRQNKFRKGEEYGSARWGNKQDRKPYINKDFYNNIILSQTEMLTMASRLPTKLIPYARNKNVLVVGGSGSGKTRFFVKPNIMQMHSSFVITDPKGSLLPECGKMLEDSGYKIKVLNLIDFNNSSKYNPLHYIDGASPEKSILTLSTVLMSNLKEKGEKDDFWSASAKSLLQSLIAYVYFEASEEEKNMSTVMLLLLSAQANEEGSSPLDIIMDDLEQQQPEHFAVKQYKLFRMGATESRASVLITLGTKMSVFNVPAISNLLAVDEMDLGKLGEEKTALFIIISDTDKTFNFICAIMYTQLFNFLCTKADVEHGGRLPVHVRFILDEFANIGQIPDFETLITTIRSREISANIIIQTTSQLKNIYKDNADTIVGNCDSYIFLGGKEKSTLKDLSELLGKETINSMVINESRGKEKSHSMNYQILGRELMTVDELNTMYGNKCIVSIRGCRPFLSKKFDITKHSRYKFLSDYDNANRYVRKEAATSDKGENVFTQLSSDLLVEIALLDNSQLNSEGDF